MIKTVLVGVAIALSANVATAGLSEGEAAIVGGILGYAIGQSNQDRQTTQPRFRYQPPPQVIYQEVPVYQPPVHFQPPPVYVYPPEYIRPQRGQRILMPNGTIMIVN